MVVELLPAPYPPDVVARGWKMPLDYERLEQSDTWFKASAEQRPWLLMLWLTAWKQRPIASLPTDPEMIALRIGMPLAQFEQWADVLLRGWREHSDGRLYHAAMTEIVQDMLDQRLATRRRVSAWREKNRSDDGVCNALPTRDQRVSNAADRKGKVENLYVPSLRSGTSSASDDPDQPSELTDQPKGKGKASKSAVPDCPIQRVRELYHERLPALPECLVLNKTREGYIRARWREEAVARKWPDQQAGLTHFAKFFAFVSQSKFLTGRVAATGDKPPFVADLEWLMRPTNYAKIIEGKYHQ